MTREEWKRRRARDGRRSQAPCEHVLAHSRPNTGRGMCETCYMRWYRRGGSDIIRIEKTENRR